MQYLLIEKDKNDLPVFVLYFSIGWMYRRNKARDCLFVILDFFDIFSIARTSGQVAAEPGVFPKYTLINAMAKAGCCV